MSTETSLHRLTRFVNGEAFRRWFNSYTSVRITDNNGVKWNVKREDEKLVLSKRNKYSFIVDVLYPANSIRREVGVPLATRDTSFEHLDNETQKEWDNLQRILVLLVADFTYMTPSEVAFNEIEPRLRERLRSRELTVLTSRFPYLESAGWVRKVNETTVFTPSFVDLLLNKDEQHIVQQLGDAKGAIGINVLMDLKTILISHLQSLPTATTEEKASHV